MWEQVGQQTVSQAFAKYDTNGNGTLDSDEVLRMIAGMGFDVDEEYVAGVMQIFGSFDHDERGAIEMDEFAALWEHLGGSRLAPESAEAAGQGTPKMEDLFAKHDTNGDGVLDAEECVAKADLVTALLFS